MCGEGECPGTTHKGPRGGGRDGGLHTDRSLREGQAALSCARRPCASATSSCTRGYAAVSSKVVYTARVPLFLLRFPSSFPTSPLRRCLPGHVRLLLLCSVTVFGSVLSLGYLWPLQTGSVRRSWTIRWCLSSYPRMDWEEASSGLRALSCTMSGGIAPALSGAASSRSAHYFFTAFGFDASFGYAVSFRRYHDGITGGRRGHRPQNRLFWSC